MTFLDHRIRLNSILRDVERPARYMGREYNSIKPKRDADLRFCLLFPDLYDIGISYHGFAILYHILNGIEGVNCERSYLPWADMQTKMRDYKVPLYSLESGRALSEFDVIGVTIQTELHYPGIVKALDLAGIKRYSHDRSKNDPIILGGGPCAFHPEPVADYFDAFLVGDGEEALPEMVTLLRSNDFKRASRPEKWSALAKIRGVYVPQLYSADGGQRGEVFTIGDAPPKVRGRIVSSLKPEFYPDKPLVPLVKGVHDRLTIEIMRGCTQGCRFCQAGMLHRPIRERSVDDIIQQALSGISETGWDEVGLLSLSTSDYGQLTPLLNKLAEKLDGRNTSLSFPSLRPATFTEEMARFESGGRKSSITFAVEAGSQRLRNTINKDLSEDALLEAIHRAYSNGWRTVKLYFIIGLPGETLDDIEEGAFLLNRLMKMTPRGKELHLSVSPFIPKPHSVFSNEKFLPVEELRFRIERLYGKISRRRIKATWHDPEMSMIEAVLARGDRRFSTVIDQVSATGDGFEGWGGSFNAERWIAALDANFGEWRNLLNEIPAGQSTAWSHLTKGYSRKFYREESGRVKRGETLDDCRVETCYSCGLLKICAQVSEISSAGNQIADLIASSSGGTEEQDGDTSSQSEPQKRYRLRFAKLRNARYLGHNDLMTTVIRSLRRAGIKFVYSAGFSPRPRVRYSQAIPLGFGSNDLWIEFVVQTELDCRNVLKQLKTTFPTGLRPLKLSQVSKKDSKESADNQARLYRLRFNRKVVLTADSQIQQECLEAGADEWKLGAAGRILMLTCTRSNGRKPNPLELGLSLVTAVPDDTTREVRVSNITQIIV